MAHYINEKKVASSPAALPDNVVFRGGYEGKLGDEATFATEKANALTVSAGSSKQPVYFNSEGKPVAIDFIPADSAEVAKIISGDTTVGDSKMLDGREASAFAEKTYVAEQIASVDHLKRQIVTEIPTAAAAKENVIYMYKVDSAAGSDKYQEYQLINGEVVMIGDTSVDLSDYAKIEDIQDGTIVAKNATDADNSAKLGNVEASKYALIESIQDGTIVAKSATNADNATKLGDTEASKYALIESIQDGTIVAKNATDADNSAKFDGLTSDNYVKFTDMDSELSSTSNNPVKNSVIMEELALIERMIEEGTSITALTEDTGEVLLIDDEAVFAAWTQKAHEACTCKQINNTILIVE